WLFSEGVVRDPLFVTTLNPVSQILYNGLRIDPGRGVSSAGRIGDVASALGYYNQRLTNVWGGAAPFTEGWLMGVLFWGIWGWIGMHCFLLVTRYPLDVFN